MSKIEVNKIYNRECLKAMEDLEDNSIDMILCDLPYGTTKNHWDSVIDLVKLWIQYKRIIKPNGAIVLTAQTPFDKILGCSNIEWLKYEWIWYKYNSTGFLNANFAPLKEHENILVFSEGSACFVKDKSNSMNYYPQNLKQHNKIMKRSTGNGNYDEKNIPNQSIQKFTNYPTSVLKFNQEKGLHPTQKPVALFEYLIKTYSNEGDLILDNCIGSGTTAISSIKSKRNFIGFEKDKDIFTLAEERIRIAKSQLKLF